MAKLLLVLVKAVTHQLRHRSLSELSASASHIAELPNAKRFLFPGGGVGGFCGSGAGVGKGGGAGAFSAGAGAGAGFAINLAFCSYPTRSAGSTSEHIHKPRPLHPGREVVHHHLLVH